MSYKNQIVLDLSSLCDVLTHDVPFVQGVATKLARYFDLGGDFVAGMIGDCIFHNANFDYYSVDEALCDIAAKEGCCDQDNSAYEYDWAFEQKWDSLADIVTCDSTDNARDQARAKMIDMANQYKRAVSKALYRSYWYDGDAYKPNYFPDYYVSKPLEPKFFLDVVNYAVHSNKHGFGGPDTSVITADFNSVIGAVQDHFEFSDLDVQAAVQTVATDLELVNNMLTKGTYDQIFIGNAIVGRFNVQGEFRGVVTMAHSDKKLEIVAFVPNKLKLTNEVTTVTTLRDKIDLQLTSAVNSVATDVAKRYGIDAGFADYCAANVTKIDVMTVVCAIAGIRDQCKAIGFDGAPIDFETEWYAAQNGTAHYSSDVLNKVFDLALNSAARDLVIKAIKDYDATPVDSPFNFYCVNWRAPSVDLCARRLIEVICDNFAPIDDSHGFYTNHALHDLDQALNLLESGASGVEFKGTVLSGSISAGQLKSERVLWLHKVWHLDCADLSIKVTLDPCY